MGWIDDILSFTGTADLARRIWRVISSFWSTIVILLSGYKDAFGWTWASAGNMSNGAFHAARNLLPFLYWLMTSKLPAWAQNAVDRGRDIAISLITDALNLAKQLIVDAFNTARSLINDVWKWLNSAWAWLLDQLSSILQTLGWVFDRVVQLLTDPFALARWLLIALWHVGNEFLFANRVAIGRWFLGHLVSWAQDGSGVIEDILLKIL